MPPARAAASDELESGFISFKNAKNQVRLRCTLCEEDLPPSHYDRHRILKRHRDLVTPRPLPVQLPLFAPEQSSPSQSPRPFGEPPRRPYGQEDQGGYDGGHVTDQQRMLRRSPVLNGIIPAGAEEVEDAAVARLEAELGFEQLEHDFGDTSDFSALLESLANPSLEGESFEPFDNAAEFGLFLLANVPTSRPGRNFLKLCCAILKWGKMPKAPTYYRLLKMFEMIKEISNEPPLTLRQGSSGYPYYHKSILAAIERDLNNSRLASLLVFYPRRRTGLLDFPDGTVMGEEIDDSLLTPMIRYAGRNIYTLEPIKLIDGSYFIPTRWFTVRGVYHCEGLRGDREEERIRKSREKAEVSAKDFDLSVTAISEIERSSFVDEDEEELPKVNPLRELAGDYRFLSVMVVIHADDFSGASKSDHNTHWAVQFSNGSLPRAERQKLSGIRLFAATQDADPLDLGEGLKEHLAECFSNPQLVYNAHLDERVLLRLYPLVQLGDTAMSDKCCGHMGSSANCNCRTCMVGGTKAERKTAAGFADYLKIQAPRNVNQTLRTLQEQLDLAEANDMTKLTALRKKTGINDRITDEIATVLLQKNDELRGRVTVTKNKKKRRRTEEEEVIMEEIASLRAEFEDARWHNAFLDLNAPPFGFDVHQRTPQDVLHVYVLGPLCFLSTHISKTLSRAARDQLQARLEAFPTAALDAAGTLKADELVKYMGSLIGREHVWLAQSMATALAPLVAEGYVSKKLQRAWLRMGELGRLYHVEEIGELEIGSYMADLDKALLNVIDTFSKLSPDTVTQAYKFHGCAHLKPDSVRYGPPLSTSCSRHETKNGRFKNDVIHSNRSAASKDIATHESTQEFLVHLLEGGSFRKRDGTYAPAGRGIRRFVSDCRVVRIIYGLGETEKPYTTNPALSKPLSTATVAFDTFTFDRLRLPAFTKSPVQYEKLASRFDIFKEDDFALVSLGTFDPPEYGFDDRDVSQTETTIVRIRFLGNGGDSHPFLSQPFVVGQKLEDRKELATLYGMESYELVEEVGIFPATALVCLLSVPHDCVFGKCKIDSDGGRIRSERTDTGFSKPAVVCSPTSRYVLNSALFRSSHLVGDLYGSIETRPSLSLEEIGRRLYPEG